MNIQPGTVFVTSHAQERAHEHYPNMGVRGILTLLRRSIEVEGGTIAPLLGRSLEAVRDRYFLTADRRGILVVKAADRPGWAPWVLITYLRFGETQAATAKRLWP